MINKRVNLIKLLLVISFMTNLFLSYRLFFFQKTETETVFIYSPEKACVSDSVYDNTLNEILKTGSDSAYSIIQLRMFENGGNILPYALVSANKWKKNYACLDVYYCLLDLYDCGFYQNIEIMDSITRKMAIDYLIKAYEYSSDTTENQQSWKEHVHRQILFYFEKGKYVIMENNRYKYSEIDKSAGSVIPEVEVDTLPTNQHEIIKRKRRPATTTPTQNSPHSQ